MLYTCYLRNGSVYVPTVGQRGAVYTIIEPVAVVSVADTERLRRAFHDTIARKNVAVPPLEKGKSAPFVVLKYAGVKSWSAFTRGTLTWDIQQHDGAFKIVGCKVHPDGYWVEDRGQTIKFAPESPVEVVVDRMIAILQDAARRE